MKTQVESLDCPNCGAPLDVKPGQEITICLYCDSSVRIHTDKDEPERILPQTEVPAEVMNKVKELILLGNRDEAVRLYAREAKISNEDALNAVRIIYGKIETRILLDRPLSAGGALFSLILLVLFFVSGYYGIIADSDSSLLKIAAWILLIFSGLSLLSVSRTIITTFKYLPGKWTPARILKFAKIGDRKNITIFRLLLEVMPERGERFQTQTNLPVRNTSINLIETGREISVKYLPNDKNSVIASLEQRK